MPSPFAVLLTGNTLCNNPRVIKEADALHEAGWKVEVLGAWFSDDLAARDRALMATRTWTFTPVVTASGPRWTALRVRSRAARALADTLRVEHHWQLGYASDEILAAARRRDADIFIAHSEPAMWAAAQLGREGRAVGVDMEDWFSEDLHPAARQGRPTSLIRSLERELLSMSVHASCPSQAMSAALATAYGVHAPSTIYNAFSWSDRQRLDGLLRDRVNRDIPSIHWYSQTIGPGRGLEEFAAALAHVTGDAEIHLRGRQSPGFVDGWRFSMPERWQRRVVVHDPVTNDELPSRIAEHDIGLASELTYCRNKDLTISNKILQYMTCGLAVVASATTGQREVAARAAGAIVLHTPGKPADIAAALDSLLLDASSLSAAKHAALIAAENLFAWEQQKPLLVASVQAAASETRRAVSR